MAQFVLQSLVKQISESHISIHHSQFQVTVNPSNGKKERVFVDLRAVYPTPDEPGTELSFEEVWAANRGWLDRDWPDESPGEVDVFGDETLADENAHSSGNVLALEAKKKLVVHQDVVTLDENGAPIYQTLDIHQDVVKLDENGAPIYPKSKPRKKKMIEVNETQISESILHKPVSCCSLEVLEKLAEAICSSPDVQNSDLGFQQPKRSFWPYQTSRTSNTSLLVVDYPAGLDS